MNKLQELYEYVDSHEKEFFTDLFPLLRKQSISYTASKETMTDCAQLILKTLRTHDFKAELFTSPGNPYVFAETG